MLTSRLYNFLFAVKYPSIHLGAKKIVSFLLIFIISLSILNAQNRKNLELERKRLIEEIKQTTSLLGKTRESRAHALDQYFAIQQQVKKRQQLINTLQQEIEYTNQSVSRSEEVIIALNEDLDRLKKEYGAMLRSAFRMKMSNNNLLFLFSSKNLNDAFLRWKYIHQYDEYRKKQVRLISQTQLVLSEKAQELEKRKTEKESLLASEQEHTDLLNTELTDKNVILQSLKKDETNLLSSLKQQQKAHENLNSAIEEIIREEIQARKREARTAEALKPKETKAETEKTIATPLSNSFTKNKGKLPWPVNNGFISRHFGTQPHPTLEGIVITNNGIDIRTDKGATVYAIFEGKVAGTRFIPGYQNTVIIHHGLYYTVYSNLEEIHVKRGDNITRRQSIGKLSDDKPDIHFEIWREKQRLNPIHWVRNP